MGKFYPLKRRYSMLTQKNVLLKKIVEDQNEIEKLRNLNEVYEENKLYLNGRIKSLHRDLALLTKSKAEAPINNKLTTEALNNIIKIKIKEVRKLEQELHKNQSELLDLRLISIKMKSGQSFFICDFAPANINKQQTSTAQPSQSEGLTNIDAPAPIDASANNKQKTSNNPNTTTSLGYLIQTLTGTTPPKYIHEDIHLANAEAQRLARKYNSSVRILEIIATIKPTTKQVPVTETIQTLEWQVSERMCELQNPNDDLPF